MSEKRGKTIQLALFVVLLLGGLSTRAQEMLMPVLPQLDSTQLELQRQIQYHQLISGTFENSELMEVPQLPKFDFSAAIAQRININPSGMLRTATFGGFMPGMYGFSPFLRNGAIFSAASYQLSNKFTVGGYSFGANSIFSAPLPNQGMNNFDTRGSTLFMQYKVSKNFKIETRVSVSQGPGGY
jgi:hypothetical protein